MSVKVHLIGELVRAAGRGLTHRELERIAGPGYRRQLRRLQEDGHKLLFVRGRYGNRWWKVVLVAEAPVVAAAVDGPSDLPALALFELPDAPPASALAGDLAA